MIIDSPPRDPDVPADPRLTAAVMERVRRVPAHGDAAVTRPRRRSRAMPFAVAAVLAIDLLPFDASADAGATDLLDLTASGAEVLVAAAFLALAALLTRKVPS